MKNLIIVFLRVLIAYPLLVSPAWATTFTWTGEVNSDWFNPGNWNPQTFPIASTDDIVIPGIYPNPVINGPATVEVNDVTIDPCGGLTCSNFNNPTLIIHGNLVNGGTFLSNTGNTSPAPTVEGNLINAGIFINNGEFTVVGNLTNSGAFSNNNQLNSLGNLTSNNTNMGSGLFLLQGANQAINGPVVTDGLVEVFGTLTTNGKLILNSGGQLLHGVGTILGDLGSVNGNITVQRIGHVSTSAVWNYMGSPVSGANFSGLTYYFDPSSATDPNTTAGLQAGWKPAGGVIGIGKGYISYSGYSGGLNLTGTVSSWNTIPSATTPVVAGLVPYNFLGNPFPTAMDAASFMSANSGILTGDMWFWDDDGSGGSGYSKSDFATWNGTGGTAGPNNPAKVPNGSVVTGQGFFVEATANGNVQFNNDMRDPFGGNGQFFRQAPVERLWVNVTNTQGLYNEVLIGFLPNATDGYDMGFDTRKRRGNPNIALYTKMNQDDYAIQALPELTGERIVELGLDAGLTGIHTLSLKQVENLDETVVILLEDRQTGTWQNLRANPSYDFTVAAPGTIAGRFFLHFNPALQIAATDESCDGMDGSITLTQGGEQHWDYVLNDANGNLVASDLFFNGSVTTDGLVKGDYTLVISDTFGYELTKIITVNAKKVTAEFVPSANSVLENEFITFTNSSADAAHYEWDFGDNSPVSTDVNPVHRYGTEGAYIVELHAWNEFCTQNYYYTINVQKLSTGINSTDENSISVYTFDKTLNLKFNFQKEEKAALTVYDVLGKAIFSRDLNTSGSYAIELKQAAAGNYIVQVVTEDKALTRKVHIGNE